MYFAIYQCFLSAVDHLEYHPSMHGENDPKALHKTSNSRFKTNVYNSHEARQYAVLNADKIEYLSK